jgi:hypothetical protein
MLNSRQRADLDNYITGHYGEDQFRDDDEPDYPECYDEPMIEDWHERVTRVTGIPEPEDL